MYGNTSETKKTNLTAHKRQVKILALLYTNYNNNNNFKKWNKETEI